MQAHTLVLCISRDAPISCRNSSTSKSIVLYIASSAGSILATWSLIPGTRICPSVATSEPAFPELSGHRERDRQVFQRNLKAVTASSKSMSCHRRYALTHKCNQVGHRFMYRTTINPRVQILGGAFHLSQEKHFG